MYSFTTIGFALWTAYGVGLRNGVCFLLAAFILVMTLLPQRAKDRVVDQLSGE